MKKLIQPMIVLSFMLSASGAVPGIPFYMPVIGLLALCATYVVGLRTLGQEDKDWSGLLASLEVQRDLMNGEFAAKIKQLEALEIKASAAIADVKSERRRSPIE